MRESFPEFGYASIQCGWGAAKDSPKGEKVKKWKCEKVKGEKVRGSKKTSLIRGYISAKKEKNRLTEPVLVVLPAKLDQLFITDRSLQVAILIIGYRAKGIDSGGFHIDPT